jgi:DNA-binding response OmpR family regulator
MCRCYIRAVITAEKDETTLAAFSPRLRVLVVDDDPDTVATLVEILRSEGHEARGNGSGQSAIYALRTMMPDVVISDIDMPEVNGWTLAREIRNVMGKHPMLIAITGQYTKNSDKALARMTGFDHYLTKPADPKTLLMLVARAKS